MRRINKPEDVWKKIDIKSSSECWEWTDHIKSDGYGAITINKIQYGAHRLAWELTNGIIPEGICVCHTCDNRKCCNPSHLFLGPPSVNVNDMVNKNRHPHCETNGRHKLTLEQVLKIRDLFKTNKYSRKILSIQFNIGTSTISRIISNKLWKL